MYLKTSHIVEQANRLVTDCGTRDPRRITAELGIEIMPRPFKRQRGVYKIVLHNPFIFLKDDLDPVMESIVLSHELGHDRLHRDEAERSGGFREFYRLAIEDIRERLRKSR